MIKLSNFTLKLIPGRVLMLFLGVLLMGCESTPSATQSTMPNNFAYNSTSWQQVIPEACQTFFDGCNKCQRAPGAMAAACTRVACMEYSEPKCLDPTSQPSASTQAITYICDDNYQFVVSIGEYHIGDQTISLAADQVIFSDYQLYIATPLQRTSSGSGTRYHNDVIDLRMKGKQALVSGPEGMQHQNCIEQ